MKKSFHIFLLLFFYQNLLFSQDIDLKLSSKDSLEHTILKTIDFKKKHADIKSINEELSKIKNTLFNKGYIESQFFKTKKRKDSIYTIEISLNKKYDILQIHYDSNILTNEDLNSITEKFTDSYFEIPIEKTETTLNSLNTKIANQGQPFSKLVLKNISIKNNIVKATLKISETKKRRTINDIKVRGYKKFPKSYLKHFLNIEKGDDFNLKKINSKLNNLKNLTFASQSKSPEVLFASDSTSLYIYLEKQKSNNFDGFLGFGTNETTNKIEFDGYLNLQLYNNLNYGESLMLLYKSDENEQRTIDIKATLPYILNSPIGIEAQLNIFRKDSTYNIANQAADVFYNINPRQTIYTGIQATQSNNLLAENTLNNIQDYSSNFYNIKYEYIKRSQASILFPINFQLTTTFGFGNRKSNSANEDQKQIDIKASKIFNLNKTNSFFLRLQGAYLISENYLENELRRFGGINSIRGFEENSIFASAHTTINTEYRYRFSKNLYLHSIIDASYFENETTNSKEKLLGFGFGFGLITKSGLLKFNYATGKSQNQKFKLSDSKIHLSLTTTF